MLNDVVRKGTKHVPGWTLYVIGAAWAAWIFYLALTGGLGPEPINALEREYGEMALKVLIIGLAITPLRTHLGVNLIKYRRAIGVTGFFLVFAHLLVWAILDVQTLERVWTEIVKRPFITVGMASFVLALPLAITSNNASVKRLGARWRKLHKLTYAVVLLGALHFILIVKGWQIEPMVYMAAILGLLALRLPQLQRARR